MASVVWWLTPHEMKECIGLPVELDMPTVSLFNSAKGRNGRGRIWGEVSMEISPHSEVWAEAIGIHCVRCAGLAVSEATARRIWELNLPGMLTDLFLRRWHP